MIGGRWCNIVKVIHGAAIGNRDQVLQSSIKLGFLTGYEDKVKSSVLFIH